MKKLLLALLLMCSPAFAGSMSTIDPTVPATDSDLDSSVIRENFLSAYNDINNLWNSVGASLLGANQISGALVAGPTQGLAVPSCYGPSNALTWTNGAGFGCNTISASSSGGVSSVAFVGNGIIDSSVPSTAVTSSGNLVATPLLQNANTILAGPVSAPPHSPSFRALVGTDLPLPSSTSLGGIQSLSATSHNFMTGISTSGVPSVAQPSCGDISNAGNVCTANIGNSGATIPLLNGYNTFSAVNNFAAGLQIGGVSTAASATTDTTNASNITSGSLAYPRLSPLTANTILGALTNTTPSGISLPSCASGALNWTSGTGFGCNSTFLTSSSPLPAANLTGTVPVSAGGTGATSAGAAAASLGVDRTWVTNRAPAPTDDTNAGYSAGQFWNYGGGQYISLSNSSGAAVWYPAQAVANNIFIGDAVPGALGAYGVIKLVSSYSGSSFRVQRTSDSTQLDIGFVPSFFGRNLIYIADWDAHDAFCAGTTCGMVTYYDQQNAYNLTAQTTAFPYTSYRDTVNGLRSISFVTNTPNDYLANSSLPITNVRNMSILSIGRWANAQASGVQYEIGFPTAKFTYYNVNNSGINGFSALSMTSPNVNLLVANGSTGTTVVQNDIVATGSALTNSSAIGFQLGSGLGDSSYPGTFENVAFMIYNSTLSAAQQQTLLQASYAASGIQPQVRDVIVGIGDSLVAGQISTAGAPNDQTWMVMLQKLLPRPITYYNTGMSGQTAASILTQMPTYLTRAFAKANGKYVIIADGTNDIAFSSTITAATVYATIQSQCAAVHTAGGKCIITTILPRCSLFSGGQTTAGFEAVRLAVNALETANWPSFADGIVDVGGDPVIGVEATFCTSTYSGDNTHPSSPTGYAYYAADVVKGVMPVIQ